LTKNRFRAKTVFTKMCQNVCNFSLQLRLFSHFFKTDFGAKKLPHEEA